MDVGPDADLTLTRQLRPLRSQSQTRHREVRGGSLFGSASQHSALTSQILSSSIRSCTCVLSYHTYQSPRSPVRVPHATRPTVTVTDRADSDTATATPRDHRHRRPVRASGGQAPPPPRARRQGRLSLTRRSRDRRPARRPPSRSQSRTQRDALDTHDPSTSSIATAPW